MKELIKIERQEVDGQNIQTVNARDLHSFLEVGKDFSNWIKSRIAKYEFKEGVDFVVITGSPVLANQNGRGGDRRSIDYHLSLDMAKELSMVERNAKGKEARQYFIECERVAKQQPEHQPVNLDDPSFLRQALLTYTEKVIQLEATVAEQKPKVEALDRIASADGLMCITDAAKTLGIRPKDLFGWMSSRQWIYKRAGNGSWIAYQNRLQQGVLEHKISMVRYTDGSEQMRERVMVTAKGIARISECFSLPA
jgi:phage anti-repressor protein/phage antirepressor YoqD-like protein